MKMLNAKKQVSEMIGFSRASLYSKIAAGAFPQGKKMGNASRWADYFVEAYTILYWDLDRELPPLSENEKAILQQCLENAKNSL